jgi:hypothetical protein
MRRCAPRQSLRMLNYTDAVTTLVHDLVDRVGPLSGIDPSQVLVFARFGRTGAAGPYATCHSLNLPASEPRYFYWKDPRTRQVTRRSEWFVTRSPDVRIGTRRIDYLISLSLPRFCNQTLAGSHKRDRYRDAATTWLAKLDTVVHELHHIDPAADGIRVVGNCERFGSMSHSPAFLDEVAEFVRLYLDSRPDPATYEFLTYDFAALRRRYGDVVATTFRQFPSYPQRYHDPLPLQPSAEPRVPIVPLDEPERTRSFTAADLSIRSFSENGSSLWVPDARDRIPPAPLPTSHSR